MAATRTTSTANPNEMKPENFSSPKEYMVAKTEAENRQKVQIYIPRDPGGDPELVVQHNGRTYQIKRGQNVMVPAIVAEILSQSQHQQDLAYQKTVEAAGSLN